jgi:hypothetical protein
MFKIKLSFCCHTGDRRLTNERPVFDLFRHEYTLTTAKISEYLEGQKIREPVLHILQEERKVADKVIKIRNKNPRKRVKFCLEAVMKMNDAKPFWFEIGSQNDIPNFCEFKFRTCKRFRLVSDNLSIAITVERVSADYELPDFTPNNHSHYDRKNKSNHYKPCVSSDSEIDLENPETMNVKYYNHNSVLMCQDCMLNSQTAPRETRRPRPEQTPQEALEAREDHREPRVSDPEA